MRLDLATCDVHVLTYPLTHFILFFFDEENRRGNNFHTVNDQ